jgi:acetamidase/formamidase
MAKNISIDRTKRLRDEPGKGHNRWHPDIPPAIEVEPGEEVTLETRDAMDLHIEHLDIVPERYGWTLRTIPPRENCGNADVPLTRGAKLSMPLQPVLTATAFCVDSRC